LRKFPADDVNSGRFVSRLQAKLKRTNLCRLQLKTANRFFTFGSYALPAVFYSLDFIELGGYYGFVAN